MLFLLPGNEKEGKEEEVEKWKVQYRLVCFLIETKIQHSFVYSYGHF